MVNKVLVLGGGSAGFLVAMTLKVKLPELQVVVLRSQEIGVIGVGEGTTFSVPNHLHGHLGIPPGEFYPVARPTWKLGIRFLWGPRRSFNYSFQRQMDWRHPALARSNGYYCDDDMEDVCLASSLMSRGKAFPRQPDGGPALSRIVAYHIENEHFVTFLETYARKLGVSVVDDTVTDVRQGDRGVSGLVLGSGRTETADLYADCSGFRSVLLGRALQEPYDSFKSTLFCDRAVVGGWPRGDEADEPIRPYTTAETMDAGWCWQIEHEHRVNRGYVYSADFVTDDAAEREFRAKNPKVQATRVVKFASGCYRNAWVKNVVGIGNAAGFVEPLESTSLSAICDEALILASILVDSGRQPKPSLTAQYNKINARTWAAIRQFLAVHYKFNTRLDTPFWRECREKTDLCGAQDLVDYYRENGPGTLFRGTLLDAMDPFGMEGYLALLVGQRVPYAKTFTPGKKDMETLDTVRRENRARAAGGLTVKQAMDAIRSPTWRWPAALYQGTFQP